jgi:hypothetical protein
MRRTVATTAIVAWVFVGYAVHGASTPAQSVQDAPRSAAKLQPVKYAYVVRGDGKALICFVESQGCRTQDVGATPVKMAWDGRNLVDRAATEGAAVAKAVHLLGAAGWDMVGAGPAYATPGADEAIHFRLTGR